MTLHRHDPEEIEPAQSAARAPTRNVTVIEATATEGAQSTRPVRQLVPHSGIQFIDIEFDAGALPMISAAFTEEAIEGTEGTRRVLLPLSRDNAPDSSFFHPVTFRPLGPQDTLSFSGLEAIEPFLDTWVPLPYLRYLGQAVGGRPRFDQGPSNWARLYIERPGSGLRGADRIKAVLAFDTRLDTGQAPVAEAPPNPGTGTDQGAQSVSSAETTPNLDDARFASTFSLVDDPEQLSWFLSQPWIDAWIGETVAAHAPKSERFTLAHLGRYVCLLKVIHQTTAFPRVRFIDNVAQSMPVRIVGVDLVVDLGPGETIAMLIPRDVPMSPGTANEHAVPLRLRDLNQPTLQHRGPIPGIVEFDNQTFGNAVLSRRSGRTDAFVWSSLVRIGCEAQRLSLRANAVDGLTGYSELHARLTSTARSDNIWRYSTPDARIHKIGPMVAGEVLRHVSEDGEPLHRSDALLAAPAGTERTAAPPAVRPRFSLSSLSAFFFAELLLHAIGQINAADPTSSLGSSTADDLKVRQIERVILTSPLAMPGDDRQLLLERVHNAIDIVWRARFSDGSTAASSYPDKPQVALSIGTDVGLQLVHLYDEVHGKIAGSFNDFVDCVRNGTSAGDRRTPLRIASLEVGMRTLGLTIIDYAVGTDGTIEADVVSTDRAAQGADRIVDALADHIVLPAIERSLAESGIADPRRFLLAFSDGSAQARPSANPHGAGQPNRLDPNFARKLETKILRPAALRLFQYYGALPQRAGLGLARTRLETLAIAGGGRMDPLADEFDALAEAAGARGFSLGAVLVESSRRQFERYLDSELWNGIDAVCEAIGLLECELVVIGGDLAGLPDLQNRVIMAAPVPPGRITVLDGSNSSDSSVWFTNSRSPAFVAVLGAYVASRDFMKSGDFRVATRKVADHLAVDGVPTRTALPAETGARVRIALPAAPNTEQRS